MLDELEDQVDRRPLPAAVEHGRDGGHGQGVGGHPAGGVGLLQDAPDRQVGAVDRPDVVQAEEAALEHVAAAAVFEVDPPGEVDQQLVEDPAQKVDVAAAVDGEDLQGRPGLDRRVDVAEVPLVGGQGPVGMLEPLPAQQDQLVLGEGRVDVGQRHAVEGQVPGREPRVLPLVGHRHDVEGVEVAPAGVATRTAARPAAGLGGVAVEPAGDVVVVELLAPEHPGERLPHHQGLVGRRRCRGQLGVELVGLGPPGDHRSSSKSLPSASAATRGRSPEGAGAGAARRSRPARRSAWYQKAHLVPRRSGLTVARPATTWSLMPSLGYGGRRTSRRRAARRWSRSRRTAASGRAPSGARAAEQLELAEERVADADRGRPGRRPAPASGRRRPTTRCCETRPWAAHGASRRPGPALVTWIDIRRSCGSALA